ncbi:HAD-IIB family hydrolase [Leucothrix mucor]|uniref:HAD-IIB family hydrolase n=1 Tax=Leucothrix mucor TaxID=45248 RepID=UPI0003B5CC96|nr:HAD-IIB family hydrolase [Leucothrix mucor]
MQKNCLVFTDLDGTLLDHHNYSHAAAQTALDALAALHIPVILNSSKTLSEIEFIAADIGLDSPRIAENGSLIAYPKTGEIKILGADYASICDCLKRLRDTYDYQFTGFNDWSAEDIAEVTGLDIDAAARAKQREASEPLIWQDNAEELEAFKAQLAENGLSLKRGGRFWHVMGQADKVMAMQYLVDAQQARQSEKPLVIALGDGPNDKDMLAAADIAVIVYNPDGTVFDLPERDTQRQIRTKLAGPTGWNATIMQLLNE